MAHWERSINKLSIDAAVQHTDRESGARGQGMGREDDPQA